MMGIKLLQFQKVYLYPPDPVRFRLVRMDPKLHSGVFAMYYLLPGSVQPNRMIRELRSIPSMLIHSSHLSSWSVDVTIMSESMTREC